MCAQAANKRGVPVFNAPFSNTRSVAELVIGEVIALARQLGDRSTDLHAGTWRKVARGCYEVRGKTLGIVGYGHIGSQVRIPYHASLAGGTPQEACIGEITAWNIGKSVR